MFSNLFRLSSPWLRLAMILSAAASLSGCVVAAVGGGAVAGYAVIAEDIPPEQQLKDIAIRTQVQQAWGQYSGDLAHRLSATVFDNEVLVTGHVPDEAWHEEGVKRAWRVEGVKQVYDEIVVGPDTHFIDEARDTWITTRLRGELVGDLYVKSIDYEIKTDDRIVYLMGIARTQEELDRVLNHARTIPDVRKVVTFIHVMPVPPPPPPSATSTSTPPPAATEDELPAEPGETAPPASGGIKSEPLP